MFKESVTQSVEDLGDGVYRCKLTDEQRKQLQSVQTAANATTLAEKFGGQVSSVEIAAAIAARASGGSPTNLAGVYADEIHMGTPGGNKVYPCAVSKATNICTASLQEASVLKLYARCRITQSNKGLAARNMMRAPGQNPFSKANGQANLDRIVKSSSMRDTELSCTAFPAGLVYVDELNLLTNSCNHLKMQMIAEFLESLKSNPTDQVLLTAYRNINRSMAEEIFSRSYTENFGSVNEGDASSVRNYLMLRRSYFDSIGLIGSTFLSSESADFGLGIRTMTISPQIVWSNNIKMGRIKQFKSGSYYVSSNTDFLIGQIPTSLEIVQNHLDEILLVTDSAMSVVENEARAENGLVSIKPKVPEIKEYTGSCSYNELLGITLDKEHEVLERLSTGLKEKATNVCEGYRENRDADLREQLSGFVGRRS